MSKVSVIIPVYNTGKYLRECIESVICQTLQDIEILLINDGSTDNSGEICDEYTKKDLRIKVFHQTNLGVSAARNNGIDNAEGEYLYFLDSDDMIGENFLEFAYNVAKANDSDLTVCDDRNYLFRQRKDLIVTATYGTFVKNEFLKLHSDIRFPVGIQPAEDGVFSHKIFLLTDKISFCNNEYFYRQYPEQNSRNTRRKPEIILAQLPEIFSVMEEFYDRHNLWDTHYYSITKFLENESFLIRENFDGWSLKEKIKIYNFAIKFFKKYLKKRLSKSQLFKLNYEFRKLLFSINGYTYEFNRLLHRTPFIQNNYLAYRFLKDKFKTSLDKKIYKLMRQKARIKIVYPSEQKFLKNFFDNIDENKVLVVEMNDCHNEVIPGYLKYLTELGYKCDVLIVSKIYQDNVFFNIPKNLYENLYNARYFIIQKILQSPKVKKYKKIFITSNYIYTPEFTLTEFKNLQGNNNILFVEHNIKYISTSNIDKYKYICLNNFTRKELENHIVNPHYFGDITITQKNENITKFLIVGRVKNSRQNYSLITDTINKLKAKNIFNYKITLVGFNWGGEIDGYLLSETNLEYKGRLNFKDMYKEVEQADFFLTLFDDSNPKHAEYKTSVTSGQIQLIYGFSKPTLIQKSFAPYYGFNENNAILYESNDSFTDAIEKCIKMPQSEYQIIQNNLKTYTASLYQKSLNNLKGLIE